MQFSRRQTLAAIGGTVIGTSLGGTASGQVTYDPDTDPLSLTDKNRDQLIAAIPRDVKRRLGRAELFVPLSALESKENTDEPTPGENGLVTFTPVRRHGDVVDMEYSYVVDDAPDLDGLTQGHIHHAPRGESDNRLFFALYAFSDLDGTNGEPAEPPISVSSTLSEQLESVLGRDFDNTFKQEDPEVPEFDTERDEEEGENEEAEDDKGGEKNDKGDKDGEKNDKGGDKDDKDGEKREKNGDKDDEDGGERGGLLRKETGDDGDGAERGSLGGRWAKNDEDGEEGGELGGEEDEDEEEPEFDGFVRNLVTDMLETPREYTVNAHTTTFQSEAIRGQVRPAALGQLSRRELVETVLATAGLEAL